MGNSGKTQCTGQRRRGTKVAIDQSTLQDVASFAVAPPTSINDGKRNVVDNCSQRCCTKCETPGCRADVCQTHRLSNFVPAATIVPADDYIVWHCDRQATNGERDEKSVQLTIQIQKQQLDPKFVKETVDSFGDLPILSSKDESHDSEVHVTSPNSHQP